MKNIIIAFGGIFVAILLFTLLHDFTTINKPPPTNTIELPKGEKLISISYVGAFPYYLTETADSNYKPKVKILHSQSGNITLIFKEQ